MVAEPKRAPNLEIELSDLLASAEPAAAKVVERPARLDVRAQSALLQEAFKKPEPPLPDEPVANPLPEPHGVVRRMLWRAVKSALGLAVVVVAGVGPVQRLLEFSSVEAVVNARLVTLRAPIEGRIADADFVPPIGAMVPKGQPMLRISNGSTA